MEMTVKFEKIALWTATQTYGRNDRGITALDHILPELYKLAECQVLDYDAEDYKLVKVEVAQAEATTPNATGGE